MFKGFFNLIKKIVKKCVEMLVSTVLVMIASTFEEKRTESMV